MGRIPPPACFRVNKPTVHRTGVKTIKPFFKSYLSEVEGIIGKGGETVGFEK